MVRILVPPRKKSLLIGMLKNESAISFSNGLYRVSDVGETSLDAAKSISRIEENGESPKFP